MCTRARITFSEFDTTSEISGLDGSTYIVVTVRLDVVRAEGSLSTTASIGITARQGRRNYELIEPPWIAQPGLADAILDYVREMERLFRLAPLGEDYRTRARTVDLDIDFSELSA
jgi:hypothetical protein